ncbi:porin [Tepidicaulis sp. LMO-SS28]|uniref:OprO/OprP family phosphate-selective porin n=1 Tax=Tepidicaulis sp. LMO-SS28 TaxID=3447455 RepID=UPI003EE3DB90
MKIKTIWTARGAMGIAALALFTAPAAAGYDVNSRIDALENELRALKAQVETRDAKLAELEASTAGLENLPVFDGKKLQISSRDGDWSIRFGGRAHIDATVVDDDVTQIGNGAEIRRLWWDISGKVAGVWKYKFQAGFENDQVRIKDAYVATDLGPLGLTIGNHKEAYSLEELTGSNYITFVERGLPNVFAPGRNIGVSANTGGANWGVTAGFFTDGINNGGINNQTTDWAVTGRTHFAPIADADRALHLGVAASYRGVENDTAQFNLRPEFNDGRGIVNTGVINDVEKIMQVGPELAAVFGPFSVQGEYHWATLERGQGVGDADLDGGYAFASWFVTGESRAYDAAKGTFGRVKAHDAIELAVRYSMVDLTEAAAVATNGEETNITAGVNYYFNPNVRVMLNYINADIDRTAGGVDEEIQSVVSRLQIDF